MIVVCTLADWRTGFYLFIVWLLFEDFVRKYMGNSTALFFGKDFLAAVDNFLLAQGQTAPRDSLVSAVVSWCLC